MKINGIAQNNAIQSYNNNKAKVNKTNEVIKKDSLEISEEARNLSNLSTDNIRESSASKIEALKRQIEQGAYRPSAELIAQRMMAIIKGSEV